MSELTDVSANRSAVKWTNAEQFKRVLWGLTYPIFRLSPRPLWGWRRAILRVFGAEIGTDVCVFPTVRITIPWNLILGDQCAIGDRVILYALGPITIGARATISQGAHLCAGTHDWQSPSMPLLKPPITINEDAWVCADAFISPGVTVGEGAIVGARTVVTKDVTPQTIVAGNPATEIGKRNK